MRAHPAVRLTCATLFAAVLLADAVAAAQSSRVHEITPSEILRTWTFVNRRGVTVHDSIGGVVRFDEKPDAGLAWSQSVQFQNGEIEFDARGRDVAQRSFLGIAFHIADATTYDVVWLRPFNFRAADTARRVRAVQFASYPQFPWQKLREDLPGRFEAPVPSDIAPDSWVHVRVTVRRDSVQVFLNHNSTPVLSVISPVKRTGGGVGLWVGDQSNGDFANLRIRTNVTR